MSVVVGCSAHGSPGVSTVLQVLASQWNTGDLPVVVEADASGGVLAARYELSLTPGFVTLAESLRKFESPALIDHAQQLPSGAACVPLSPSATAASAQLRSAGPYLGPYLAQSGHPVLVDAGTLLPDGKGIAAIAAADLLLWFVRPTREELLVLRHRLAECPQPAQVAIVLVGNRPYDADQVSEALETEVIHTLPIDRRGATAVNLGGDDRFLRRSQLARSCAHLVELLQQRLGAATTRTATAAPEPADSPVPSAHAESRPEPASAELDAIEDHGDEGEDGEPDLVVWVNEGQ